MANPNKTARGSASTPASRRATAKRKECEPFVLDMNKFQRGEMTAEDFMRKYDPNFNKK